jgi:predicted  nucleic acid-binding Zn-ribbon protein
MKQEYHAKKTAVMFGLALAFLVAIANLYWQFERMRTEMAGLHQTIATEMTKLGGLAERMPKRNRQAASMAEPSRKILDSLKDELTQELARTKSQVAAAARHADDAISHADQLAEQLGEDRRRGVEGELGQIKEAEATTTAKIDGVTADLVSIKNEVASSRYDLQQTVSELKRVTGDLGVQSDYIATNAKELLALKSLGERNYFDFHVERTGKPQRVGEISITLKKTDPKHNKYTLEVLSGDTRTEKADRSVNEPVQFYVTKARSKGRRAVEIVVNEVRRDYIVGYLSTPRELVARMD